MKYTIKQIAEIAGVSRGTVDRVIHSRNGVNPIVRDHIQKLLICRGALLSFNRPANVWDLKNNPAFFHPATNFVRFLKCLKH